MILGTEYAGEMKKGVFTIMNYLMPKQGVLSMHCSANGRSGQRPSSLLFGLSGTGKTTLSADPERLLIGDDEHCWSDDGVFNIEGGCYAKAIDLTPENEPDIFQAPALRRGAGKRGAGRARTHRVDFHDVSITENTRGAYPIEFIRNAKIPCVAGHPTDVIFLTCDAFGVLPPVQQVDAGAGHVSFHQRLHGQSGRHRGGRDRAAGDVFSLLRRTVPGLASDEIRRIAGRQSGPAQRPRVAGQHRLDRRQLWRGRAEFHCRYTRAIIDAIHAGRLASAKTVRDPVFGIDVITECPGVPAEILIPRNTWADKNAYDAKAHRLAELFRANFAAYSSTATSAVGAAEPAIA